MLTLKKLILTSIKYGPSIMVLTCCFKILILSLSDTIIGPEEIIVNIINVILNILLTIMFYIMGKYFGYCWKHRSLCRTALYGYIGYILLIILNINNILVTQICLVYVMIVIIMTIIYSKNFNSLNNEI